MDMFQALTRASGLTAMLTLAAFSLLGFGYFFMFWDRRKSDSANKDDGQIGLKLVLYSVAVLGLGMAAGALSQILGWALAGGKTAFGIKDSSVIKSGIGSLIAGGAGVAAVLLMFLPRTNAKSFPQIERFALGAVAALAGFSALLALDTTLSALFGAMPGWPPKAHALASLIVSGGVAGAALMRLGTLSGWVQPVRPAAPMMQPGAYGQPPQGYGMPQAQMPQAQMPPGQLPQGQPPQGQPPQGYGMPPGGYGGPGGQMPPQGGGYPPSPQGGGGYPPPQQGGSGLPPPPGGSGGGFPPR